MVYDVTKKGWTKKTCPYFCEMSCHNEHTCSNRNQHTALIFRQNSFSPFRHQFSGPVFLTVLCTMVFWNVKIKDHVQHPFYHHSTLSNTKTKRRRDTKGELDNFEKLRSNSPRIPHRLKFGIQNSLGWLSILLYILYSFFV